MIGPGDSCKSTLLDAIELVHYPRWNVVFDDSDFFNADPSNPIVITSTICDFPADWIKDDRFGLNLRGWGPDGLLDEPQDDLLKVLSIQMKVDGNLEPEWRIVNDRTPEGRPISARDREKLGVFRLGNSPDYHLGWSRTSILSRLTTETDDLPKLMAEVSRSAMEAVRPDLLPSLKAASAEVQKSAKVVGYAPRVALQPLLDAKAISFGSGAIALHDGKIPVRRAGLGSRRLLTMSIQRGLSLSGGLCLVDEIEHGLEPHRLRRLLQVLRAPKSSPSDSPSDQTFVTSHAPIVLAELKATELFVVRTSDGSVTIGQIPGDLQPLVRTETEAFLARKIIVCEGKTELGFLRGIDNDLWERKGESFSLKALALANGNGRSSGPQRAKELAGLGYSVLYFGDSDDPLSIGEAELTSLGIKVVLWADNFAFEDRLAHDLPWDGIVALLDLAEKNRGLELVLASVAKAFLPGKISLPREYSAWLEAGASSGISESEMRRAIGKAANIGEWFKRVDRAEPVASLVRTYWAALKEKDSGKKICEVTAWAGLRD
ncbi:ATP-dependent endonuclease [Geothrix sp. PMB-07]|uniref:ATP-dependent nuclease n=1 Tax=Geothrix sp. PMB-07 TaxID=3068640 RepID=UPI002740CE97|nr:AAA family ATPase [Geothrix sp. PMB-07]WLT32752.1 AAA family ATPase [Geothrix sp. PMB-07]